MATEQRIPKGYDLAQLMYCYPVISNMNQYFEQDDLIALSLTSKNLWNSLHPPSHDDETDAQDTSAEAQENKEGAVKGNNNKAVEKDSYFKMLFRKAKKLECEVPPPGAEHGGSGSYSRPCSRTVKRCVKCQRGACRLARSFDGRLGGNVRKACLECLIYGTNPILRIEDRQCHLDRIAHRRFHPITGIEESIPFTKNLRYGKPNDFANTVLGGRCGCMDKSDAGYLRRWVCWECEEIERFEGWSYKSWCNSNDQEYCECGNLAFNGILREGAVEPEIFEEEVKMEEQEEAEGQEGNIAEQDGEATAAEDDKSRTTRASNGANSSNSNSNNNDLESDEDSNGNNSNVTVAYEAETIQSDITQQKEALPAALGLCAWCGLRVYGLHPLEDDGRPLSERLAQANGTILGYGSATEDEEEEEEEREDDDE